MSLLYIVEAIITTTIIRLLSTFALYTTSPYTPVLIMIKMRWWWWKRENVRRDEEEPGDCHSRLCSSVPRPCRRVSSSQTAMLFASQVFAYTLYGSLIRNREKRDTRLFVSRQPRKQACKREREKSESKRERDTQDWWRLKHAGRVEILSTTIEIQWIQRVV